MREGNVDEALRILRLLVLTPGCTWMRPEVPNLVKRNYATALLLNGHPSGCLEILSEMRDESHPRVGQLRAAIKQWEKTLSWLEWLNWRTGWIEPDDRPVKVEFVPGELEDESPRTRTTLDGPTNSPVSSTR